MRRTLAENGIVTFQDFCGLTVTHPTSQLMKDLHSLYLEWIVDPQSRPSFFVFGVDC